MKPVSGNHWLEPLLPERLPESLLALAERLPYQAGRLAGALPPETAACLGGLLRVTSSFYSNLIEGQFTEPVSLAPSAPKRTRKELSELAVTHIAAQGAFERAVRRHSDAEWAGFFSPEFVSRVHRRLFAEAAPEQLALADGARMLPGRLRDADQLNVMVGRHFAPDWVSVTPMLRRMQAVYGAPKDGRTRVVAAMAYHHRLAWVHPFADGNGRVVRLVTHLHLQKLGLNSPLWSLSRGIARQQDLYYAKLANADQPRRGDLDGRGQLTQAGLFEFIEFMLGVCLDQMNYIEEALQAAHLRDRIERVLTWEPRVVEAGVRREAARALHTLLALGEVSRADFKAYMGLGERTASEQLGKLVRLGLVTSPTPRSRTLLPALPVWYAQLVFPNLHQRIGGL